MSYEDRPPAYRIMRHLGAMRGWERWKPKTKYERVIELRRDTALMVSELDAWLAHYQEYRNG